MYNICTHPNCSIIANYGFLHTKHKERCTRHKLIDMVNLRKKCPMCALNFSKSKLCIKCLKIPDIEKKLILQYLRNAHKYHDNNFRTIISVNENPDYLLDRLMLLELSLNTAQVCLINVRFDLKKYMENDNINPKLSFLLGSDLLRISKEIGNIYYTLNELDIDNPQERIFNV